MDPCQTAVVFPVLALESGVLFGFCDSRYSLALHRFDRS